jgi:hypothetical protein
MNHLRRYLSIAICGSLSAITHCTHGVDGEPITAALPVIVVVDSTTNAPICDATILIVREFYLPESPDASSQTPDDHPIDAGVDGSTSLPVYTKPGSGASSCYYTTGGSTDPNTYDLQVSKAGYKPVQVDNVYDASSAENDPVSRIVTVRLQPVGN